eukprot:m.11398 g.11398  ORF g.11398 m.11398 type:complete len:626 (+) comp4436_c0_seq1:204-2081(+)
MNSDSTSMYSNPAFVGHPRETNVDLPLDDNAYVLDGPLPQEVQFRSRQEFSYVKDTNTKAGALVPIVAILALVLSIVALGIAGSRCTMSCEKSSDDTDIQKILDEFSNRLEAFDSRLDGLLVEAQVTPNPQTHTSTQNPQTQTSREASLTTLSSTSTFTEARTSATATLSPKSLFPSQDLLNYTDDLLDLQAKIRYLNNSLQDIYNSFPASLIIIDAHLKETMAFLVTVNKSVAALDTSYSLLQSNVDGFNITISALQSSVTKVSTRLCQITPEMSTTPYQQIPTTGASAWESFTIDGAHFLIVANFRNSTGLYEIDSPLYKWVDNSFQVYQPFDTKGALDWEHFKIKEKHFLIVANSRTNNHEIDSILYLWDGTIFRVHQRIPTQGANSWKHFLIDGEDFLVVANYRNNNGDRIIDSHIFRWDGVNLFDVYQNITTVGATDWEYFEVDGMHFIMAANYQDGNGTFHLNSTLYQWNGTSFHKYQEISTVGARDCKHFTIGDDHYLAIANNYDGENHTIDSVLYKWNGTYLEKHQSFPTEGANTFEFFESNEHAYLVVANFHSSSQVYQWNGTFFDEFQTIESSVAKDWRHFVIDSIDYLAVANYEEYQVSRHTNSSIYQFFGCQT